MESMEQDDGIRDLRVSKLQKRRYYGDNIRRLFFAGGVLMIITLPFFNYLLPLPVFGSVLAMLIIGLAAGLTNPRQKSVIIGDVIISAIAFLAFEYHAATGLGNGGDPLFFINQALAILFFISFYLSIKSLRWFYINNGE